jgi:hypothetical protein
MHIGRTAQRVAALSLSLVALGCSSLDNTNYGPPGGLTGKKLPLPSGGSTSGSSGGSSGGASDAGASDSAPAGASDCGVSWTNEIFPQMITSGSWKCGDTSSCHGGVQSPSMTADPTTTYDNLAAYTMRLAPQPLPYVMPGDPDPSKSGIECNLTSSACGNRMPLTSNGARHLNAQEAQTLDTWVRCGSPNN